MTSPLIFQWDGDAMVPLARFNALANKQYVVGEIYRLGEEEERSAKSHKHYFAALHDGWGSLPDALAPNYPDDDKLRKDLLLDTGWYTEQKVALSSDFEARKMMAFLARTNTQDGVRYAVAGPVLIVRTARSQKTRGPGAMNKADFQKSKQDVLDALEDLIGLERGKLLANAGRAA